jgi:hypothetical protein
MKNICSIVIGVVVEATAGVPHPVGLLLHGTSPTLVLVVRYLWRAYTHQN